MLELDAVNFTITKGENNLELLREISFIAPDHHFMAIVGPSGCGKSTLLKTIAGINEESDGNLYWQYRNLAQDQDFAPNELAYVPQFSVAYECLSVADSVLDSARLRLGEVTRENIEDRTRKVLEQVGLSELADNVVATLSGGQRRRLGLAIELIGQPQLMLCDEVTSGLDPKSENEIVHLLHDLANEKHANRLIINVTHSLSNLDLYDSALVMHEGRVAYHGSPKMMNHYFSVENSEDIYPRLALRAADEWQTSWQKHRAYYYKKMASFRAEKLKKSSPELVELMGGDRKLAAKRMQEKEKQRKPLPSIGVQFIALLRRRFKLFFRDRGHLLMNLSMLIGFPILVVLFALNGVDKPPISPSPSDFNDPISYGEVKAAFAEENAAIGAQLSGLVMFQVILLALMASNNSAREIAGERNIYEKEKFAGLSPHAYVGSKLVFLIIIGLAQSLWMWIFVKAISAIPGHDVYQLLLLFLLNIGISFVCLGISALTRTPEQSSLASIYLVGFQLPLSGAVLALPGVLREIVPPFISSYWSWAGQLDALRFSGSYYEAVKSVVDSPLQAVSVCIFALLAHALIGVFLTFMGAQMNRW